MKSLLIIIFGLTVISCLTHKKQNYTYSNTTPSIYSIPSKQWVKGFSYDSTYLSLKELTTLRQGNDTSVFYLIHPKFIDSTRNMVGLYSYETFTGPFPPSHNMEYFFLKSKDTLSIGTLDSNKIETFNYFVQKHIDSFDSIQLSFIKDLYFDAKYCRGCF